MSGKSGVLENFAAADAYPAVDLLSLPGNVPSVKKVRRQTLIKADKVEITNIK